jgi:hypothetical protein
MNTKSPIDSTIDKLVLVRKVTAFANLGIYAGARILDLADKNIESLKSEQAGVQFKDSQAAVRALRMNILPSQSLCQASMAELDVCLIPLRAQRRNESESSVPRPRPV